MITNPAKELREILQANLQGTTLTRATDLLDYIELESRQDDQALGNLENAIELLIARYTEHLAESKVNGKIRAELSKRLTKGALA